MAPKVEQSDDSLAKMFLERLQLETGELRGNDLARYISCHVAIGIAYMRGLVGEEWTREFIMSSFTAVDAHGVDTFTKGEQVVVLPREPSTN